MSIHITSPPHADRPEPEVAEPARRASRFDERGIALQTVIIMVVLLAIAASVAAVLLGAAGRQTNQLESASTGIEAAQFTSKSLCQGAGHGWNHGSNTSGNHCIAIAASTDQGVKCADLNPRWKAGASANVACLPV